MFLMSLTDISGLVWSFWRQMAQLLPLVQVLQLNGRSEGQTPGTQRDVHCVCVSWCRKLCSWVPRWAVPWWEGAKVHPNLIVLQYACQKSKAVYFSCWFAEAVMFQVGLCGDAFSENQHFPFSNRAWIISLKNPLGCTTIFCLFFSAASLISDGNKEADVALTHMHHRLKFPK